MPVFSRRKRRPSARSELRGAFNGPAPEPTPQLEALWARYRRDRDDDSRNELLVTYLPLCTSLACFQQKRYPQVAFDFDELISDATIGLLRAIEGPACDRVSVIVERFRAYAAQAIITAFWQEPKARKWGGYRGSEKTLVLKRYRKRFARESGRLPTREECGSHLARLITNPSIQVGDGPKMLGAADMRSEESFARVLAREWDDAPDAPQQMIDREAKRFALDGLTGRYREIFLLAIEGYGRDEIARRTGERVTQQQINAVLWQVRQRADLAACLDVEPATAPARNGCGQLRRPCDVPARLIA